jgi:hypothetical protein
MGANVKISALPSGTTPQSTDTIPIARSGSNYGLPVSALETTINVVIDYQADPTGTADSTAAIQNALNAAGTTRSTVYFPAGAYKISQLVLTTAHNGVRMLGPSKAVATNANAATLQASGSGPMLTNQGTVSLECFTVENLTFNGNNVATVGVYLDTTIFSTIANCWFISFASGAACIKGGGCLYSTVTHCVFDGSSGSRSLDFQNGYAAVPANSYYGCNDGWFTFNADYTGNMMRIGGDNYILSNDLEGALNTPALAAIDCTDVSTGAGTSKTTVSGNYIELTAGTAGVVRAIYTTGTCAVITNNTLFGPPFGGGSPTGTAMEFLTEILSGEISGNSVRRWNIGLQMNNPGTGSGSTSILGNYWEKTTVTTSVAGFIMHSSSANAGGYAPTIVASDRVYVSMRSLSLFVCDVQTADTTIDLSYANSFSYDNSAGTTTLTGVVNAKPGALFWITCVSGSLTLTNGSAAFNLAAGANYTIPPGRSLMFQVPTNGKVYEVGNASA